MLSGARFGDKTSVRGWSRLQINLQAAVPLLLAEEWRRRRRPESRAHE